MTLKTKKDSAVFIVWLFVSIFISTVSVFAQNPVIKGKVTGIDPIKKIIKLGEKSFSATNVEFGVVPVGVGGKYDLMDSGRASEVEVGDDVEITYKIIGNEKVIQSIKNRTRKIERSDVEKSHYPFLEAAEKGNFDLVKKLISKGIDVNSKDKGGKTALMFASANGHLEIVYTSPGLADTPKS